MSRLRALFSRYCDRHFCLKRRGVPLPGGAGYLDCVQYTGRGVALDGWAEADSVRVRSADHEAAAVPRLMRRDVAAATGRRADVGFHLELPEAATALTLTVTHASQSSELRVPCPNAAEFAKARRRLLLPFTRDLLRSGRHLWAAFMHGDQRARAQVKACLGLDAPGPSHGRLEDRLFECAGLPQGPDNTPITIILPVYNAFELLAETLERVVTHTDLPWHLVLIDDASPDPRVYPFLRDWCEWQGNRVTLLENKTNLGFVGTVNRGFAVALERGDHVVLLNSDALVPSGWASRLVRPFARHRDIASVTPLSNDATIMNAPVICSDADLPAGSADAMDAHARSFNPEALVSVVPTGVGFCMAMNIDYLRQKPRFDSAFGRGYCEEVDWCQQTRKLGGRHLGLPGLFVEHRGGQSFGSQDKQRLMDQNARLITARYPNFDPEVHQFIANDPMATARLALGVALAAEQSSKPIPIYIAHSMGGGAELYLAERIRRDLLHGLPAVVLRVGGKQRWRVELHREEGMTAGNTDSFDFVETLLEPLTVRRVIYSNAVGDSDPLDLPDKILRLVREGTPDRLEILMHDYFPLSPSYTLLDRDLVYRGPVETGRTDRAHSTLCPDGRMAGLAEWRAVWGRLLLAAERVVVFSKDSRSHVLAAYPWAKDRLEVLPHSLPQPIPKLAIPMGDGEVIGVLGAIGPQKGAGVLAQMGHQLKARKDLRLVVIGTVDPSFDLPADVAVTGSYRPSDIPRLAAKHGVTRWLIPSIWPETFSYTTHEALATGLPVHAFDIGAQGEAVHRAPNGIPMRFNPEGDLVETILHSIPLKAMRDVA